MTYIQTARVREVIGVQIGIIQESARKLNMDSELQQIETDIAALEQTIADLKQTLAALPHQPI